MDWFDSFIVWLKEALSPVLDTPSSALFIFATTFGLVLVVMIIYRLVTDVGRLQTCELEVRMYTRDLNEAKKRNDRAMLRRLKREEVRFKQFRSYASKQRLKAPFISIIPFMIVSLILSNVYTRQKVAISPFELPIVGKYLPFSIWYSLCYFAMYFPLSRVFGMFLDVELDLRGKSDAETKVSHKKSKRS